MKMSILFVFHRQLLHAEGMGFGRGLRARYTLGELQRFSWQNMWKEYLVPQKRPA